LWNLILKVSDEINKNHVAHDELEIIKFTNKFIKNITQNLENFSYNIIIANIYEMYSFWSKEMDKKYSSKTLKECFSKTLICINPILPHISNEGLELLKINTIPSWPNYEEKFLIEKIIPIVVQINGKKRGILNVERNILEEKLLEKIFEEKNLNKYLENKDIRKKIFIDNKLINIIV